MSEITLQDMNFFTPVVQFVVIFMLMASSAVWLRHKGVLSAEFTPAVSRMITDIVLPALIFYRISDFRLDIKHLDSIVAMILAECAVGIAAWAIGRYWIRLNRPALGTFILASTFGSTSLMGTALIQIVFPDNPEALATGMLVAQAGVGFPLNTIGVLIAIYFGGQNQRLDLANVLKTFIKNPVVLAFIAGLAWSHLSLPQTGMVLTVVFGFLKFSGVSLTFLVALLTGLTITPLTRKDFGRPLIACALLLLVVEPVLCNTFDRATGEKTMASTLLLLLGAMPASPLVIAFSVRYGCDTELASKLVVNTCFLSIVTLPLIVLYYG